MEGRDPWTGFQEGSVMDDCTSIHVASVRQSNSTLFFSLPGMVKCRCLQGGSNSRVLGNQQVHFSVT